MIFPTGKALVVCVCIFIQLVSIGDAQTESATLDNILTVTYSQLNLEMQSLPQVLPGMCKSTKTQYKLKLQSDDHPDVYRIPHSRIFEEDTRCGDKDDDYPEERLWIEPHMTLAPYELLKSNVSAIEANIFGFYTAFHGNWRKIMQTLASKLETNVADADMWIGWEQVDRVCNQRVILQSGSFVLFARAPSDTNVVMQINMLDPKTEENYNKNRTSFEYFQGDDIHMSFYEVLSQQIESYDLICPSQNASFDIAAAMKDRSEDDPASCFPSHSTVQLESGEIRRIDSLSIGDRVLVGSGLYSTIFMFTHKVSDLVSPFVFIITQSGAKLSLTKGHYLYANDVLVPAGNVVIGDFLMLGDGTFSSVVSVDVTSARGLFNPQTEHGDIVVDGVVASTFTTALEPALAHGILAPFRFLCRLGICTRSFEYGAGSLTSILPKGAVIV